MKGPHRARRAQIQRQSGVIKKNNLDVGGMRRKTYQSSRAALVEQPQMFSAGLKM